MADMTPEAALYAYLNGFGMPAYASTSAPSEGDEEFSLPYNSYDLSVGDWSGGEVNVPVRIWDRTESEAKMNAKVREIGASIGMSGLTVPCEGGMLWLKKGSPWAQASRAEDGVKCRYLNIDIEYLVTE